MKVRCNNTSPLLPSVLRCQTLGLRTGGLLFVYNSHKFSFSGKRRPEAASSEKEGKGDGELPYSIGSVLCSFREFCAIMWLLHARDKMSKSSRKYRQLRSQSTGSEEVRMVISNRGLRMRDRPNQACIYSTLKESLRSP